VSICVSLWDASPRKLLNGFGSDFAQGWSSAPDTHFGGDRPRGAKNVVF